MSNLTESQAAAVNAGDARVLCVAGPGAGKTSVLVARVQRLIGEGVPASEIAVLTFTNAAARELEERLGLKDFPKPASPHLPDTHRWVPAHLRFCGTLHAFALRALRDHGGGIGYGGRLAVIDEDASAELLASKAKALGCKAPAKRLAEVKAAGRPETTRGGPRPTLEQTVVAAYYDDLRGAGIVDLDAILPEFLRLLLAVKGRDLLPLCLHHLLIDEAQDSSEQDWAIYKAYPAMNKFVVGDPDQAIYGFRGGRQDLFLEFARDPEVRVITLEENFRCAAEVCDAANRLIAHNRDRLPKLTIPAAAVPSLRQGQVDVLLSPHLNEGAEVACVVEAIRSYYTRDDGDVAVLARSNAVAAAFRDALVAADVQVQQAPRADLPPDWALARALVELLAQPDNDTLAFFYVAARERRRGTTPSSATAIAHGYRLQAARDKTSVNAAHFRLPRAPSLDDLGRILAAEGISAESRAVAAARASALPAGSGVLELAADMAGRGASPAEPTAGVHVGTIHGAKGREWDEVYLVGFEEEATPGAAALKIEDPGARRAAIEEERRVAFVGVTRARRRVWFSHAAQRRATWGRQELLRRNPSRFVAEAVR